MRFDTAEGMIFLYSKEVSDDNLYYEPQEFNYLGQNSGKSKETRSVITFSCVAVL